MDTAEPQRLLRPISAGSPPSGRERQMLSNKQRNYSVLKDNGSFTKEKPKSVQNRVCR